MVAKLTDVAALAGVSPTTVSRVINKKGYLSQKTIDKVNKAMRELGYKPNNLARSLQGKSPQLIGLIFPNISNIFYAELIEHLEIELFKQGYKAIICNSENNPIKERDYLEMLAANQVDGIISSSHNLGIDDYERVEAPIVAFDRNLAPNIPIISSDNFEGGKLAAKTLQKHGCQKMIMITGNDHSDSPTGLRQLGFNYQLKKSADIIKLPNDLSSIRREMEIKSILATRRPDGIFASDDLTAILIMKVAGQLGIAIPDNLKLIGYDGTAFIEHYFPQLTTIKQPIKEIASLTVEVLLKKIGNEKTSKDYVLPITLLPGASL
ncbi:TPA: LacI family DNA-binding transcriptional regulator [Streptococcus equi subsp. zooepidemicus]|uniref:LacI family DNA-binding transcriptional regulator n=1 Tax=Streptococcus equi TaxID=1336 RepID=UPI001E450EF9|nr:LacI family DNA-binding transcriptional regulator [Streptococcus equi]MCD3458998.1 LacI family DNA-binding transcriptional regulator [Streptococcus equi subsp. zooepidemicus]MDI5901873.1 LacI family DNA-binding transcriptional regulator [Streptococcus equi subsp. zooepidemicus]MDI5930602.1 LacI family DNA-binding transcriptional regulator [Streptococcus equi subsp. zooepidemicus]MDI6029922.1 LacI family DNA-binding transcriptional regulator [Streptococcus equi subsp. zooepidemicus]HEL077020